MSFIYLPFSLKLRTYVNEYNIISDFIGRNVEQAKKIMEDSDLKIHVAEDFEEAARLAVANAKAYMKSASAQS